MLRTLLLTLFFLIAINTDYVINGAKCWDTHIKRLFCSPCSPYGARCLLCEFCTGFCYNGQAQTTKRTLGIKYGSVEALYKVPFFDMFNDIKALLEVEGISDATVVNIYKEASDVIREDCTICNNSPDLNNLSRL